MIIWTQADVDALAAAVKTGVLSVHYEGPPARTITYASLPEMRALLAEMVSQVQSQNKTRRRFRLAATRKGL